jgi:hypothetical protein
MLERSSRDDESTNDDDESTNVSPIDYVAKSAKFFQNPEIKLETTSTFSRSLVFLRTNRIKCLIRETFGDPYGIGIILDKNISYLKIKNEEKKLSIDLGTGTYYAKSISKENHIIYLINVDSNLEETGYKIKENLGNNKINYFFVSPDDKSLRSVGRITKHLRLDNIELHDKVEFRDKSNVITVLPCSHELSFKKSKKCDGNQNPIDNLKWRRTRSSCLNKILPKERGLINICEKLKTKIENGDLEFIVDWSVYRSFYDKHQCRTTSLFQLIGYFLNNNAKDFASEDFSVESDKNETVIRDHYADQILQQRNRVNLIVPEIEKNTTSGAMLNVLKASEEKINNEKKHAKNIVDELKKDNYYISIPGGEVLLNYAEENVSDLDTLYDNMVFHYEDHIKANENIRDMGSHGESNANNHGEYNTNMGSRDGSNKLQELRDRKTKYSMSHRGPGFGGSRRKPRKGKRMSRRGGVAMV